MRITILQGAFFPVPPLLGGAVEKIWLGLGEYFAAKGHRVTHLSCAHPDLLDLEQSNGVEHRRVASFSAPRQAVLHKVLDFIYTRRALQKAPIDSDFLITNTFWGPVLAASGCYGRVYVHVARFPKRQMALYRRATRIQTVSGAVAEAVAIQSPQLASKLKVIPNPLPFELPAPESVARPKAKTILYVGRVHTEKGIHLLTSAFARIARDPRFEDWRLQIVGPAEVHLGGSGSRYLESLKSSVQGCRDRVEFTGAIFDPLQLQDVYRNAAIFAYPSLAEKGESFGLAPLEAMAFRCATIVSDLRCFTEFIGPDSGRVFQHRTSDASAALEATLREILPDPIQLDALGSRGREEAAKFALPRIAQMYLQDFEVLLGGTGRAIK